MSRKYTAAEKIEYYKNLANARSESKKIYKKKRPAKAGGKKKKSSSKKGGHHFSKWGSMLGGAIGSTMGPVGGVIGAGIGGLGGAAMDAITGHGAYKINRNTVYQNSVPQFTSRMTDGCIRIRHKEYITDVVSSATPGAFQNIPYRISASDARTFPYLSQIAVNFEEFMFEGLVFSYVPSSGSISTTGQLGTVILATQYNALSQPFTNKQQAEASTYSVSQVASMGCLHPVECDAKQTPSQGIFYTLRPSLTQQNQDPRWQQLGQFNLMTQGMPAAEENVGELYVSYDVICCKPILIQDDGMQADHWQSNNAGLSIAPNVDYFGSPTLTTYSDGFTSIVDGTHVAINSSFNGNISVTYALHWAAGGTGNDPSINADVGLTDLNILDGGVTLQYLKTYSSGQVLYTTAYFTVKSTGVPSTFRLANGAFGAAIDYMDLIITSLPADFN